MCINRHKRIEQVLEAVLGGRCCEQKKAFGILIDLLTIVDGI
jgi:hypothetical protein